METWETLTMSRKEVPRAGLLKAALAGRISNTQGARALDLSVRQFQRVKRQFAVEGAPGLRHRLRGRPSPRRLTAEVLTRAAWGLREAYVGLNARANAPQTTRRKLALRRRDRLSIGDGQAHDRGLDPRCPAEPRPSGSGFHTRRISGGISGSGPAYSRYFKQIAKAVVLPRP